MIKFSIPVGRQKYLPFILSLLLFTSAQVAVSQSESPPAEAEEGGTTLVTLIESLNTSADEFVEGVVRDTSQFYNELATELAQVEGDYLADKYLWIIKRVSDDSKARVIWILIVALFVIFAVLVFSILLFFVAFFSRRKRVDKQSKHLAQESPTPQSASELTTDTEETPVVPNSDLKKLQSGFLEELENSLLSAVKENKNDYGSILFLFACCAARLDNQRFEELIDEVFEDTPLEQHEVGPYIIQIGRLIDVERLQQSEADAPEAPFTGQSDLLGDTFGEIHDIGGVDTCWNMLQTYVAMRELGKARHMIVELLVYGEKDLQERTIQTAKDMSIY